MALTEGKNKKVLSIFGLVMINIVAVDSIRALPISAEYGFSAVFYYLLAGFIFFIPAALVSAELATAWPETGGIYVWVREAFGKRWSFFTIWLQWFYNICWYPTIMSLMAGTLAYLINPSLVTNRLYMVVMVLVFFWGATLINLRGMKASMWLSNIAAIIGTLLPMLVIIILGVIWIILGKPLQIQFSTQSFLPDLSRLQNLVLLTAVLYGLVGMEMSAVHAREVKNPQRDYPKSLLISAILILASLIFASLAIAVVVPQKQLNLVAGMMQAFDYFFTAFGVQWLMPVLAILIILGALGGVSVWVLGPAKGLLVASRDGSLPKVMSKTGKDNVPVSILWLQGIIVSILSLTFLLMPSVNSAFWLLTDVTSVLALVVYLFMFSAAIVLRYKAPHVKRAFKVPGGNVGMVIIAGFGFVVSAFVIVLGFFPPSQIAVGSVAVYEALLSGGVVLALLIPLLLQWGFKKVNERQQN